MTATLALEEAEVAKPRLELEQVLMANRENMILDLDLEQIRTNDQLLEAACDDRRGRGLYCKCCLLYTSPSPRD